MKVRGRRVERPQPWVGGRLKPDRLRHAQPVGGTRFEIPARLRHLSLVQVRYARWDISPVGLVDAPTEAIVFPCKHRRPTLLDPPAVSVKRRQPQRWRRRGSWARWTSSISIAVSRSAENPPSNTHRRCPVYPSSKSISGSSKWMTALTMPSVHGMAPTSTRRPPGDPDRVPNSAFGRRQHRSGRGWRTSKSRRGHGDESVSQNGPD